MLGETAHWMPKSGSPSSFYDKIVSVDFADKAVKDFDFLFFEPFILNSN